MVKEELMFKGMICFADRRVIPWLMAVFFFLGLTIPGNALSTTSAIPQVLSKQITGKVTEPDTATRTRLVESYSRLPLSFEANHGQTDGKVKFLSRGSGYNLFLTATEAVLSLRKAQPPKARIKNKAGKEPALHKADKPEPATVVAMKLVGANADPRITGANQLPGKVNYFLGKDPKKWRTNIPIYARVRYTNVYPGIDLVFYGQGQKLEYDFIVAPGADPDAIALCFGQTRLKIDQNGDLALDARGGELRLQKPLIYQDIDGIRKPVPGGYVLHPMKNEKQTHRVGFKVADYDRTRPLVIDPVLVYSTYLGGSNYDSGYGIAVDATGSCYVTGYTDSTDFPTHDPLYPNFAGNCDAFVTRLSPAGDALVYSTYLGGSSFDYGYGIAVDATGNCYVTGETYSTDFPTQDPLYPNNAGGYDAFVSKISSVVLAPVADFSADPTTGTAPLAVNFTDLSTGSITDWAWDFGDGGTSTEQNPTHTYNTPDTYTVSLTVTDPGGSDTETKIDYITVSEGWEGAYDTLFRHPSDLTLLRQYRDEFLSKTAKGKLYTRLLYNRSEKALQVLLQNPELLMEAKHLIEANKGAVSEVIGGEEGVIYNTDEIISFLDAYASEASPALKALANMIRWKMVTSEKQGEPFLGFRLK
jgi:PKD repeat protein